MDRTLTKRELDIINTWAYNVRMLVEDFTDEERDVHNKIREMQMEAQQNG